MKRTILKNGFYVVMALCAVLVLPSVNAFAQERERRHGHEHEVVVVGHQRYHYHDGRFFRPGWFGIEFVIGVPPIGAIVTTIPISHRTIVIGGARYYYYNNAYYTDCPEGYIVVPTPVVNTVVVQPEALSGESIIINVPNSNGSYTPVKLIRRNHGYIGPQGEYYEGNPTVDQLKALYGK